jgi:hypothetical protein
MLKVEPTEAENVVVPWPEDADEGWLTGLAEELDISVRSAGDDAAQARADQMILRAKLNLSQKDCDLLRAAADSLRGRRYARSTPA